MAFASESIMFCNPTRRAINGSGLKYRSWVATSRPTLASQPTSRLAIFLRCGKRTQQG